MPDIEISSADDPRLDVYRDLKHPANQVATTFVAEGEKLVLRLLDSPCDTESILCTRPMRDRLGPRLPDRLPIYIGPTPLISRLIGFQFHRGILACGRRPGRRSVESLCDIAIQQPPRLLVLCPEIRDPENLGTIIRTATAFGAAGVIAGESGTDPFSRRVLRTSMGSVLRLPIAQTDDWQSALSTLHRAGFETIAAVLAPDAVPLSAFKPLSRTALLLGNEDAGLPAELVSLCRHRVTLPMSPGVDSLNVAIAGGILMYHLTSTGSS